MVGLTGSKGARGETGARGEPGMYCELQELLSINIKNKKQQKT